MANLIFNEFEKPVALCLIPGLAKDAEIEREVTLLNHVDVVVVPKADWGGVPEIPGIRNAMGHFKLSWKGEFFAVYGPRDLGHTGDSSCVSPANVPRRNKCSILE